MGETDTDRTCPRCDSLVQAEQRQGDEGLVHLWRCGCGWAGARTVHASEGVKQRRSGLLQRVFGRDAASNPDDGSTSDSQDQQDAAEKTLEDLGFSRR